MANAINSLLDHVHVMDSKMEIMCAALKRLDADYADIALPELDDCGISDAVDERDGADAKREKLDEPN